MSATEASAFDTVRDHKVPLGIFRDTVALARRGLIAYRRVPQLLVFSTIQPVIFVVMFRYVFGGAVAGSLPPGVDYVDYLMPGIFVQTVVFGSIAAAIGLATDMKSGLMERFHALPMSRAAVLTGRTTADLCRFGASVRITCGACGAARTLSGAQMAQACGAGSLRGLEARLKCSRCGAKAARVAVLPPVSGD